MPPLYQLPVLNNELVTVWKEALGLTLGTVMTYLYPEDRGSMFLRNYRAIPPDCFEDDLYTLKMEAVSSSETIAQFRQTALKIIFLP